MDMRPEEAEFIPMNPDSAESKEEVSESPEYLRLSAENAELKDKFLRVAAEAENVRRRLEKEKAEGIQFASERLLKDLIPVLDAFGSATGSQPDQDLTALKDGMILVQKMLLEKLEKHGLTVIDSVGKSFDPNFHQAIQRLESGMFQKKSCRWSLQKATPCMAVYCDHQLFR